MCVFKTRKWNQAIFCSQLCSFRNAMWVFSQANKLSPVTWLLMAAARTAAHQAPPSLGFSGQEHWSGVPFPSPLHESEKWKWSRSVVSNSSQPHGLQPTRLLRPWDFPGKSTGLGCHRLLHFNGYFAAIRCTIISLISCWVTLDSFQLLLKILQWISEIWGGCTKLW